MHGVVQSKDIDAGVISTNIELPKSAGVAFEYCSHCCSILVIMILLVEIVGHVNIFVFFLLMVTLTVFVLIFLVLVFLEGLCACFANWRQVRTLEMDLSVF